MNTFKYRLTCQEDSTNTNSRKEILFDLLLNVKESLFQASKRVITDSISFFHNREKANQIISYGRPINTVYKFNYKIVKNNKEISIFDEVIGLDLNGTVPLYNYKEHKNTFDNWELLNDTLSIGKFLCQKATIQYGGRKWIAYFTSDIPIFDGPYVFCGLPGLILKIHDENHYWNFDLLTSINHFPSKHVGINFQAKFIPSEVSKEQFLEDRRQYQNNLLQIIQSMGNEITERTRDGYNQRLKADNNWIELKP